MIRFFADIIYLFFFLTLTAPLYPLFDHWNKTGKAHKRSSIAQRMILRSFKICLAMAGTKLIVDGQENIPGLAAVTQRHKFFHAFLVLLAHKSASFYGVFSIASNTKKAAGDFPAAFDSLMHRITLQSQTPPA